MIPTLYFMFLMVALAIVALGVVMLKVAYDLKHPMEFIATFFAASLVILIGGALTAGFGLRVYGWLRKKKKNTS